MGIVKIRCPVTGEMVSTGIEADFASFDRLPDANALQRCPACGQTHAWTKNEAWHYDSGANGPTEAI